MHDAKTTHVQNAENCIVSWDRITVDLVDRAWDFYEGEWEETASTESEESEGEFGPQVTHQALQNLV
jgi:hypothetical protein